MTDQDLAIKEAGNQPGLTFKGYTFDYSKAVFEGTREVITEARKSLLNALLPVDSIFSSHWNHDGKEPVEMWTMWI